MIIMTYHDYDSMISMMSFSEDVAPLLWASLQYLSKGKAVLKRVQHSWQCHHFTIEIFNKCSSTFKEAC